MKSERQIKNTNFIAEVVHEALLRMPDVTSIIPVDDENGIIGFIVKNLKVGQTEWVTETYPEGQTFMTNMVWNGNQWVVDDNQDYLGTTTDIKNYRGTNIG
jgi:hypothetical protein